MHVALQLPPLRGADTLTANEEERLVIGNILLYMKYTMCHKCFIPCLTVHCVDDQSTNN